MGKSVAALAKFTIVATITFMIALTVVYTVTASWAISNHMNASQFVHHRKWWPQHAQSIVVAFADMAYTGSTGVALILPVENSMKDKDKKSFLKIVISALATAGLMFTMIGTGCALVFSYYTGDPLHPGPELCDNDCSSITAIFEKIRSGGEDICPKWVLGLLNWLLIGGVILTFPLQLFPAAIGAEKSIKKIFVRNDEKSRSVYGALLSPAARPP